MLLQGTHPPECLDVHRDRLPVVELLVEVEMTMVKDGGERELAVGDDWTVDLLFDPEAPMQPASEDTVLEFTSRAVADPLAGYRITARVHRLPATGEHIEGVALEVPGFMLGYYLDTPLPDSPVVTGRGTLATDSIGMRTMSWAFPAIKRSCVVEEITLVTAPLIPVHEEPATDVPDWLQPSYVPDWTRRTDTSIRRMRRWEDEPKGWLGRYFVTVRLAD